MTQNQFIQEKVLGRCYHDTIENPKSITQLKCIKCRTIFKFQNELVYPDFSQHDDWWELWEFCKKQEWWVDFIVCAFDNISFLDLIDLYAFREAIAQYFGWEG
jgi:hypothetical protein